MSLAAADPVPAAAPPVDLAGAMARAAHATDAALERLLPRAEGPGARVAEAMRYAVFAGGKRLRPFLVLEGARLFEAPAEGALRAAAAIECVHTYSLVHDDLPAMDDDDLRRGRPTTHKAFDEATAILAGDALQCAAFELLAEPAAHPDGAVRSRLVAELARASGVAGMVGGQMMDIEAPARGFTLEEIAVLQGLKTGALFRFSALAGPLLGGAEAADLARFAEFARDFGLAFQVADDLIDATGDAAEAGKAVGKDADAGKATFVSLLGVDGARAEVERLARAAADALAPYGEGARALQALAFHMVDRRS
jgi:farnesyl diphosphate synthase